MRDAAEEAGYLRPGLAVSDLLNATRDNLAGRRIFSGRDAVAAILDKSEHRTAIRHGSTVLNLSQRTSSCAAVRMERRSMLRKMFLAKNTRAPAILAIALCLSACAGIGADYRPVVDMSGHTQAAYDRDVAACQQTAAAVRNNTRAVEDAGMGVAGGSALGFNDGGIGGDPLLAAGAGGGGYEEAAAENHEQRIVKNCMRARGYTILG
jgi:outer membrane lipoprotein SlyB